MAANIEQRTIATKPYYGGSELISLASLIELSVQKSYHDLMLLSEILLRKSDLERKTELLGLCKRTRGLFFRLLALVRWAGHAVKVDKCAQMAAFLERQCGLFVDTADRLARVSRETLVRARLPNLCVPQAIDVVTLGTYPRMPSCIRIKTVPPEEPKSIEKNAAKRFLDRELIAKLMLLPLPKDVLMRVGNGVLLCKMPHLWSVRLTLTAGDWRLLKVRVLTTRGWLPYQRSNLHTLLQSRLSSLSFTEGFFDLTKALTMLSHATLLDSLASNSDIPVDVYVPGNKVRLTYWSGRASVTVSSEISLQIRISHSPAGIPPTIVHGESLSAQKIIALAIEARTKYLLLEWKNILSEWVKKAEIQNNILHLSLLQNSDSSTTVKVYVGSVGFAKVCVSVEGEQSLEFAINNNQSLIGMCIASIKRRLLIKIATETLSWPVYAKVPVGVRNILPDVDFYIRCKFVPHYYFALAGTSFYLLRSDQKTAVRLKRSELSDLAMEDLSISASAAHCRREWTMIELHNTISAYNKLLSLAHMFTNLKRNGVVCSFSGKDNILIITHKSHDKTSYLSTILYYQYGDTFVLRRLSRNDAKPFTIQVSSSSEVLEALQLNHVAIDYSYDYIFSQYTGELGTRNFSNPNPCAVMSPILPHNNKDVVNTLHAAEPFLITMNALCSPVRLGLHTKVALPPWMLIFDSPISWKLIFRAMLNLEFRLINNKTVRMTNPHRILQEVSQFYSAEDFAELVAKGLEREVTVEYYNINLINTVGNETAFTIISTEPHFMFRTDTFTARWDGRSLDLGPANKASNLSNDDIRFLKSYFHERIHIPPWRPAHLTAFLRMLIMKEEYIKDFCTILRLEREPSPEYRWAVQWCWSLPPHAHHLGMSGNVAIRLKPDDQFIFLIQLSPSKSERSRNLPDGNHVYVVPIVLNFIKGTVQCPATKSNPACPPVMNQFFSSIATQLDIGSAMHPINAGKSVLWIALKEVLLAAGEDLLI